METHDPQPLSPAEGEELQRLLALLSVPATAVGLVRGYVTKAELDLASWIRVRDNRRAMGLTLTLAEAEERVASRQVTLATWQWIAKAVADRSMGELLALGTSELAVAVATEPPAGG